MSQLRQDLVTGHWVAVSAERARRPFASSASAPNKATPTPSCPFCEGHEAETPPELLAVRLAGGKPNTPGWQVRVVPNLFPAFSLGVHKAIVEERGIYRVLEGIGVHEVVVLSPSHREDLATLSPDHLRTLIQVFIQRYTADCADPSLEYLMIIGNSGAAAGASIEHPHSQLLGLPIVPPAVQREMAGVARYRGECGRCIYCEIIRYERASGERVVYENDHFLVYSPFAGRLPFETSIIPRWHASRFELMTTQQQQAFADALHQMAGRTANAAGDPAYNFYIHTAPCHAESSFDYHWHLEFLPRLTIQAGFEWGSGITINITAPEEAAKILRATSP